MFNRSNIEIYKIFFSNQSTFNRRLIRVDQWQPNQLRDDLPHLKIYGKLDEGRPQQSTGVL